MIYDRIKEICEKKNLSISAVEKKAKLSPGAISKWNKSSPTVANLQAVADAIGCSLHALLK